MYLIQRFWRHFLSFSVMGGIFSGPTNGAVTLFGGGISLTSPPKGLCDIAVGARIARPPILKLEQFRTNGGWPPLRKTAFLHSPSRAGAKAGSDFRFYLLVFVLPPSRIGEGGDRGWVRSGWGLRGSIWLTAAVRGFPAAPLGGCRSRPSLSPRSTRRASGPAAARCCRFRRRCAGFRGYGRGACRPSP